MTTGQSLMRVLIGGLGVLLLIAGIVLALLGAVGGFFGAFWLIVAGVALIIAVLIEVSRYRSEAAERDRVPPGPGGGEPGRPEPRFQRTEEAFVDPTTGVQMRVYLDPLTGERRYVAEG